MDKLAWTRLQENAQAATVLSLADHDLELSWYEEQMHIKGPVDTVYEGVLIYKEYHERKPRLTEADVAVFRIIPSFIGKDDLFAELHIAHNIGGATSLLNVSLPFIVSAMWSCVSACRIY